eukprot:tig00020912_g15811.t1
MTTRAPEGFVKAPLARSNSRSLRDTNKSGFGLNLQQLSASFRGKPTGKNASFRSASKSMAASGRWDEKAI